MKLTSLVAFTLFSLSAILQAQTPAPVTLPPQAPDVAAIKYGPDGKPNAGFMTAHDRFLKIAQEGKTELLFLGDSITAGWGGQKAIW